MLAQRVLSLLVLRLWMVLLVGGWCGVPAGCVLWWMAIRPVTDDGERGSAKVPSLRPLTPVKWARWHEGEALLLATDDGERGHGEDAILLATDAGERGNGGRRRGDPSGH